MSSHVSIAKKQSVIVFGNKGVITIVIVFWGQNSSRGGLKEKMGIRPMD